MKNILYVEDVPFIRKRLAGVLESYGFKVCEAGSSCAAYRAFKSNKFDIAIVDINIPYDTSYDVGSKEKSYIKDGFELAKIMLEENPNLHVIILSGNIKDDKMIVEGANFGIKDFIAKPYDSSRLLQSVIMAEVNSSSDK